MPDGDVLLLRLVVDGHIRGLVNLSGLQNQHLGHTKTKEPKIQQARRLESRQNPTERRAAFVYRKAQPLGGSLRGFHDDVHPEVESLPLWRMFHRLLLEPQDQLQVLHHRPQIPGGKIRK